MRAIAASVLLLGVLLATHARAQSAQLQLPDGRFYADVPVDVLLVVDDFEEDPRPDVYFEPPPGASLELAGYTPRVSSSISIVNGQVTQQREVRLVFRYRLRASQPGTFRVGPFKVVQDGTERIAAAVDVKLDPVPLSDDVKLRLSLPERPVFPGERVPVVLEWGVATPLRERIADYSIVSPLFERSDVFQFIDDELGRGQSRVQIVTPEGEREIPARAERRRIGGREFVVFVATRTLVPLRAGTYELGPSTVLVDEVTRWRRGLLGTRSASKVRKLRAQDRARRFVVEPIPSAGRPASFAGAVGRSFDLDVTADRSVVREGEPIQLTIVLRGDGNLEGAGLPDLSASGLPARRFRLPSSDVGGVLEDGAKTFELHVRALDAAVTEIPALDYAYFDPEEREFRTVRSRPIALSVRETPRVTADDVVGAVPPAPETAGDPSADGEGTGARLDATTLADLSVVTDARLLLRRGGGLALAPAVQAGLYASSLLLVSLAWWVRRRRELDPHVERRRRVLRDARRAIETAGGLPRRQAAETIARALREAVREVGATHPAGFDAPGFEALIAECETIVYAPRADDPSARLDDGLLGRAHAAAQEIEEGTS